MTQAALDKYATDLPDDGILITDSMLVQQVPERLSRVYELPITATAKEELGRDLFANIVALGAIVELTDVVTKESLVKAVLSPRTGGNGRGQSKGFILGSGADFGKKNKDIVSIHTP
jgi:2-oxoglutarate ferredoxin oxidoreductase subunit gamma